MKCLIECVPEKSKPGTHMEMEGEAFFCTAITPNPGGGVRAVTRALGSATGAEVALALRCIAKQTMEQAGYGKTARAMFVGTMIQGLLEAETDG